MPNYDDYTPHIFYNDEQNDGENEASLRDNSDVVGAPQKTKKARNTRHIKAAVAEKQAKKQVRCKDTRDKETLMSRMKSTMTSRTTAVVTGIILAGFAAFFLISFVSYIGSCISDQSVIYNQPFGSVPEVANKGGEGGARLSEYLINGGFGLGSFVIIIWVACIALKLLIGRPKFRTLDFTIKCFIGFITISLIIGLLTIGSNTVINWGGYHGRYVNEWIIGFLGWWGAIVLCIVMVLLFVVLCMRNVVIWIIEKKRLLDAKRRERLEAKERELEKQRAIKEFHEHEAEAEKAEEGSESENVEDDELSSGIGSVSFESDQFYDRGDDDSSVSYKEKSSENQHESQKEENAQSGEGDKEKENGETVAEAPMVVNVNQIVKSDISDHEKKHKKSMYQFPPIDLLKEGAGKISVNKEEQLANKELIKQTLKDFGVDIVSVEAHVGPTITLYEVRPDKGYRVAKIRSLGDDISLSLAAKGVRIIAPLPGRGTVGIEVANKHPQTVSMRSILQSEKYQTTKAILPLALGSTISNDVYIADLASIPHLLVSGATGQGKSVGLNVIIASLLYKKRPDELKFVLFDPKEVEFNLYDAIRMQYMAKLPDEEEAIITDMCKVVPTLSSLCVEMDNRYKLLKAAEVRKLEEYNKLVKSGKLPIEEGHKFLPYIVVIVDEFSDLIMTAGKEVELPIARLAQKARAIGIHVIIATQRPSTAVITGNIKTNFPGRMAFKVSSGIDSKVIIDTTGAQQLIGRGDMLILNNSDLVRVQCACIDTDEVKAMCEHIGAQPYSPDSPYILPPPPSTSEMPTEGNGSLANAERDPLYEEIRTYVITSGVASTSNIQRKYGIGYNRAGRIMDQLEADGVVGPSQGGKARAVLMQ